MFYKKEVDVFEGLLLNYTYFRILSLLNKHYKIKGIKIQTIDEIKGRANRKKSGGHRTGRDTKYSGFWRGSQYRVHRNEHPAKWRGDQS